MTPSPDPAPKPPKPPSHSQNSPDQPPAPAPTDGSSDRESTMTPDLTPPTPSPIAVPPKPPRPAPAPPAATPAAAQTPTSSAAPAPEPGAPDTEAADETGRHGPIPPPSEPMQYRAIGLIRGRYIPAEEQFTRGEMITSDGTKIDAVLLGRVMSLVRKHINLEEEHLWVVYPRTRPKDDLLHIQIVGVWEPETLNQDESEEDSEADAEAIAETPAPVASSDVEADYFSIRGEIVFQSPERESLIIKIQQAARKEADKAKAFKLNLCGTLDAKAIGQFWDLQVSRQDQNLVVTAGKLIGVVPPRKRAPGESRDRRRPPGRGGDRPRSQMPRGRNPRMGYGAPARAGEGSERPQRRTPPPAKPIRRNRSEDNPSSSEES